MTQPSPPPKPRPRQDEIDLAKLFFLALSRWYVFLVSLAIALPAAWFYIQHTLPTYRVTATLLIEEGSTNSYPGTEQILEGFGLRPGMKNLDNQIIILQSRSLIRRTLAALPFSPEWYTRGRINAVSLYPQMPYRVEVMGDSSLLYGEEFRLSPLDEGRLLLSTGENGNALVHADAAPGDTIPFPGGSLVLHETEESREWSGRGATLFFAFHEPGRIADSFRSRLNVETASREGTILRLSLEGTNRERDRDFLDRLTEVYLNNNLEKKNQEATRIIQFIDQQLAGIADSLEIAGDRLEEFRSTHRVMDLSAQGQQILEQALRLEDERAGLQVAASYYDYLDRYLAGAAPGETPVAPSTMGISDPLLGSLVQELAGLQGQYQVAATGERNPMQATLARQIASLKASMRENLKGISEANRLATDANRQRIRELNVQASDLPSTERRLLGIERQYKLNDALYTFLLEKRAEASIQKASSTPDHELVDAARPDPKPVAPKTRLVYLIALALGLGLPLFGIILADLLGSSITGEDDIKALTDLPLAGHILHSDRGMLPVVLSFPQGMVAESFRSLRTRLQFLTRETPSPVVLVTSSMPEEGKTFTALNLASACSLSGKKTVLVGFDLRRPRIFDELKMDNEKGVSTWLIGRDSLDEVIRPSGFDNLDVIPAGPIPPNPAELTEGPRMTELLRALKERYECIILDSAPMGTVADSYPLARAADAILLLVRHGKTPKRLLAATLAEAKANGIDRLAVLVNDLRPERSPYGYRYGYGYGYGYRYGYAREN